MKKILNSYRLNSNFLTLNFTILKKFKNIIAVRIDNSHQPNTRRYSGSGIYRHVWLVITEPLHVAHWGSYITTPEITESEANVNVQTTIENDLDSSKNCSLITKIFNPDGKEVGTATSKANIPANDNKIITQTIQVATPKLWSIETPWLYKAINEVKAGTSTVDSYETVFGIRTIEYNRDVAHVTIEIIDADGNVVPTADNLVKFTIEGQGRLIGMDNGNPRDHLSYQISQRHAFNGLCLAIVQSAKKPGKIRFEARSDGLMKTVIDFEARNN